MQQDIGAFIGLVGGVCGLVLSILVYRRQGTTIAIENLSKAYDTLSKDYQRQAVEIKNLREQLEREQLRRVTLQEHLDIAREVIEKLKSRVEALEAQLSDLKGKGET